MNIKSTLVSLLLSGFVFLLPAQAASFDCSKAQTLQEKLICFDYRLSDLDSQLAWSYGEALKQSKNLLTLKQSQRDWVVSRGRCASVNCIIHAYVERIEELMPESKQKEVYFPKEEMSWEFLPKPGYRISDYLKKKDTLVFATYPVGSMSPKVDLIIPVGERMLTEKSSVYKPANRWQKLPLVNESFEPIFKSEESAYLGGVRIARVATNYGECQGGIATSGVYTARNLPWAKNNVLVTLRPSNWVPFRHQGTWIDSNCEEPDEELKVAPFVEEVLFNESLYLYADSFVVRLNKNLQTASSLLGKKIFLVWGNDIQNLTKNACDKFINSSDGIVTYSTKQRVCIDEQLQKIIGEVGRFYN